MHSLNFHRRIYSRARVPVDQSVLVRQAVKGKNAKGVIGHLKVGNRRSWFFYPEERHFGLFEGAALHRKGGGLAEFNRGPVGTIIVSEGPGPWTIEFIAAHFRTGDPGISRAMATRYGGWRHRTLDAVFRSAAKKKVRAVRLAIGIMEGENSSGLFPPYPSKELEKTDPKRAGEIKSEIARRREFIEVAGAHRFLVGKEGNVLAATKPAK